MPQRSPKPCVVPGCRNTTTTRWCEVHAKTPAVTRPYDQWRGSSASRGYDNSWRKLRLVALKRDHYLCQRCLESDRPTQATEVHHIVGIDVAPELRLVLENLASMCAPCHKYITECEQGIWGRKPTNNTA